MPSDLTHHADAYRCFFMYNPRRGGKTFSMPVVPENDEPFRIMRDAEVVIVSSRPLTTTDGIVPDEIEQEEITILREIVTPSEQKPVTIITTT